MFVTLGEGVVFGEISILNIPDRCSSSLTIYFVICYFTTLFSFSAKWAIEGQQMFEVLATQIFSRWARWMWQHLFVEKYSSWPDMRKIVTWLHYFTEDHNHSNVLEAFARLKLVEVQLFRMICGRHWKNILRRGKIFLKKDVRFSWRWVLSQFYWLVKPVAKSSAARWRLSADSTRIYGNYFGIIHDITSHLHFLLHRPIIVFLQL